MSQEIKALTKLRECSVWSASLLTRLQTIKPSFLRRGLIFQELIYGVVPILRRRSKTGTALSVQHLEILHDLDRWIVEPYMYLF